MEKIIEFAKLLHAFERTDRAIRVPGLDRLENDAEHSYVLATFAWYLIDTTKLKLDKEKVFRYSLAHDIAEVYAGDTPAFGVGGNVTSDNRKTKDEREAKAIERLKKEFPEFPALTESADAYASRKDPESQFVYALDKLLPIFGGMAQEGRDWKQYGLSFDDMMTHKVEKIKGSPELYKIFMGLMEIIGKDKQRYFNQG